MWCGDAMKFSARSGESAPIPRTVWALGLVSLFMDLSSEIIHALLPVFLTTTLGASVAMVSLIDGIGESTASITKMFSGYVSDRIGRRKPLILLGCGLGALSKPFLAIAAGPLPVLDARFGDGIGKGLRAAPRWSPMLPHSRSGATHSVCASLSILWARSSGHWLRSRWSMACARYSGLRSFRRCFRSCW